MWLDVRLQRNSLWLHPQHGAPENVRVGVRDRIYYLRSGHRRKIRI